jgi:hypothetical protein
LDGGREGGREETVERERRGRTHLRPALLPHTPAEFQDEKVNNLQVCLIYVTSCVLIRVQKSAPPASTLLVRAVELGWN